MRSIEDNCIGFAILSPTAEFHRLKAGDAAASELA